MEEMVPLRREPVPREERVHLADRMAVFLAHEERFPREQAHGLARKMVHEMIGDVGNDFYAFVTAGPPAEDLERKRVYWDGEQYWQAIDPGVARILRAVNVTQQEIEILVMG